MSNKVEADFVLVASGSIAAPQLNIIVYAGSEDEARRRAVPMAEALARGDVFGSFELFDVRGEHRRIARLVVRTTTTTEVRT